MYLKRIELHGFKSFAGSTDILLERGITGIVGPNGSGKSNIVDALRWVLGEQSSRNLRGATMQDVIFKGTQRRSQKGSCEVSLVFDNSDRRLDTDYTELRVTRVISRAGESEYRINGVACRLKDVQALFTDTGIGKDGYSIIGQGRIQQILEDRAAERRHVFEEAAGIMKYRTAKEEAERNLEKTRSNTERVSDIVGELKEQAGPLHAQMEQAREFLALSTEVRILEVGLLLSDYDLALARERSEKEAAEDACRQSQEISIIKERLVRERTALRIELERAEARHAQASEKTRAAEKREAAETGRQALEQERIRSCETQLGEMRGRIEELAATIVAASGDCDGAEKRLSALEAEAAEVTSQLEPLSNELRALEASSVSENSSGKVRCLAERGAMERSRAQEMRVRAAEMSGRVELLRSSVEHSAVDAESAARDLVTSEDECKKAESALVMAADQYASAHGDLEAAAETLRATEDSLRETLDKLASAQGRMEVLTRARSEYEGYYDGVRLLMRDARDPALGKLIVGVVGECIAVEPRHETAIETALGSAAENVVVPDDQCARKLVAHLRSRRYGRVTFLPASALRIRRLSTEERKVLSEPGVLGAASDAVRCSIEVRPAVDYLLGRTVIVDNLDTALRLKREQKNSFRIVTASGEIVSPGGAITGGDSKRSRRGFLERRRVASEAHHAVQELHAAAAILEQQRERQLRILAEAQDRDQDKMASLAEVRARRERAAAELEGTRVRFQQAQTAHDEQREALIDLSDKAQLLEREAQEATLEADKLEQEAEEQRQQEAELAESRMQLALHISDLRAQVARRSEQRTSLLGAAQLAREEAARARKAGEEARAELEQLEERCRAASESLELARAEYRKSSLLLNDLSAQIVAGAEEIDVVQRDVQRFHERTSEIDARITELDDHLQGLLRKEYAARAECEKAAGRKADCLDRLWTSYELTLGNARSEVPETVPAREARGRIREIRKALRELGPVNPHAPQDYSSLTDRITELESQAADLETAQRDLQALINDLTAGMEKIFQEKLRSINEHFQRIFAELFGGGSASLVLEEDMNVMEAGIEIQAEPPGKKLQNLSLMSGGERALTAVALVFAMLAVNPSPVCLLDEIDAPLDDRNVERLAAYLRRLSDHLQFIVITHKKTTMSACDALYGVAMHEKGISDLVSVQLT